MRTAKEKLNKSLEKEITTVFAQLITDLKTPGESISFIKDFLTETEQILFTKRLAIGYWLAKKRNYENIKKNLKVSSATIATVSEMLKKPGFMLAIKKIESDEWANRWAERIKKIVKK
ncbi:hypothetical protein A3D84_02510 [Candidatus Woesebacteria bacterium RIFCSPHIGHO2_02_FULL_42_20]|uniref:TrpR like protein, YerC/YecD n=1 Tax=Candidatus Woesebacteria bacterium RIFCSPHIGHO2_12_FULL_41_24 TaxID=1802510 RepID=A0A1F8APL9_9BACT|nr:MAG: hypothetical protein A2W15_02705 [Candidatus Woesebacteria bacterium RBG_16_41_13]OGM29217.1 MAG: hypothetical protein A2873_03055 [Candidatus Woesebacteria bacterium RIFCSPHIGHO2_01_FULL_42_80]OGM34715.1 MAG: hypothetical protein A3D84_02510 [Candidatus Woesebacteria bacterium RIFCSPHIGHO2_02_FULL_42_20]OGM53696.1 MAG: hypothetical protein A3E44_02330 [Candidatus Woesebacteria bacterium RIFCSPHIGHO2_12_FULL_41_24]OGM67014.1 MAG: hypothetical protein A2969_05705 [Candidatus Woesebacteri